MGKTEHLKHNQKIKLVPKQINKYNTKSFVFVLLNHNLILKVGMCFVIFLFSCYDKEKHSLEIYFTLTHSLGIFWEGDSKKISAFYLNLKFYFNSTHFCSILFIRFSFGSRITG